MRNINMKNYHDSSYARCGEKPTRVPVELCEARFNPYDSPLFNYPIGKTMLIEFSVRNFRSIKNEQTLSMESDSGETNMNNTFQLSPDGGLRLLKTVAIYGPNASGKTNVIAALYECCRFIVNSTDLKLEDTIKSYQPFKLDRSSTSQPTSFKIVFLGKDRCKYQYEVSFNQRQILTESLISYPNGQAVILFIRTKGHTEVELGDGFLDKNIKRKVLQNRLFLSESANNLGDTQMGEIYSYFKNIEFWNLLNNLDMHVLARKVSEVGASHPRLSAKLSKLIKICDTQIDSTSIREREAREFQFPNDLPEEVKEEIITQHKYRVKTVHTVYDGDLAVGTEDFELNEESQGTKIVYAIGGIILKVLETGGVVCFDEFNNSLHPKLCRFLVELFHHPHSNPNHAQLIFATHETTLLDKSVFRKDQIWFTEKNKRGETELFSASDFEGIQDNIPFREWYLTGKFGAQPCIKEIEFIYGDNDK